MGLKKFIDKLGRKKRSVRRNTEGKRSKYLWKVSLNYQPVVLDGKTILVASDYPGCVWHLK